MRFILRHPDGDGFGAGPSWRAGRTHVARAGLLAALLLVLGSHLEWKVDVCGSGDGRARVATTEAEKYSSRYAAFFRARAEQSLRCDSLGMRTLNRHFYRGLSHARSVFIIGKCRNRMKSSLVFLRLGVFQKGATIIRSVNHNLIAARCSPTRGDRRFARAPPRRSPCGRARSPRVAAAGAAGRVRRPRARRRAAGVQVRAAARADRSRRCATRSTRGGGRTPRGTTG